MPSDSTTHDATDLIAGLIRERRTIHDFKPDEVPPKETILKALDLARWAPNHHLTEPWHFYLLGKETAAGIARLNAEMVTAKSGPEAGQNKLERWLAMPGWLVLTCFNSDDKLRAREDYAACCCAAQNFMLYLWSGNIGVKWTTGAVTRDISLAAVESVREVMRAATPDSNFGRVAAPTAVLDVNSLHRHL